MEATVFADSNDIGPYLRYVVQAHGSDLFLTVGAPPSVKIQGVMQPMKLPPLSSGAVKALAYSTLQPTSHPLNN